MRAIRVVRRSAFAESLWFAALSAGALPLWLLLARPLLGADRVVGAYLIAAAAAYLGTIAPARGRALVVAIVVTLVGGFAAQITRTPGELVLALCVVVAVTRSGFLYRAAPARGVVLEAIVSGGGLLFARFLCGPSTVALVLSVWGFFLVQSLYFLVGGAYTPGGSGRHQDPFQDAYGRAIALLENGGR